MRRVRLNKSSMTCFSDVWVHTSPFTELWRGRMLQHTTTALEKAKIEVGVHLSTHVAQLEDKKILKSTCTGSFMREASAKTFLSVYSNFCLTIWSDICSLFTVIFKENRIFCTNICLHRPETDFRCQSAARRNVTIVRNMIRYSSQRQSLLCIWSHDASGAS